MHVALGRDNGVRRDRGGGVRLGGVVCPRPGWGGFKIAGEDTDGEHG